VYNGKLTPLQRAACQVLQITPRTPFLITDEEFHKLMKFMEANIAKWEEILHNEGVPMEYTCIVYKGAINYRKKNGVSYGKFLCSRK